MKKKILVCCVVLAAVLIIVGVGGWKMGWFTKKENVQKVDMAEVTIRGAELTAMVDSTEEAEKIAVLYGIELQSYADGVAVFTTEEPVNEVISRGKEAGYPELSLNLKREPYTLKNN